jgi:hypothetical protein
MCLQLVEVLGDDSVDLNDDSSSRLKQALQYLSIAILANNQQRKLSESSIELSSDPSFSSIPLPDDLQRILLNAFQTSMTPPLPNTHPAALKAALEVAKEITNAKDAKGKPAKSATAPVVITPPVFTGRDAIHLLATLTREVNPFHCDGFANDLALDVHLLLKKTFPIYNNQCSIPTPPSVDDQLSVPTNTVSTSWAFVMTPAHWFEVKSKLLSATPSQGDSSGQNSLKVDSKAMMDSTFGFYSHASVFFMLGDGKSTPAPVAAAPAKGAKVDPNAVAQSSTSTDPVLTKVVLYRGDVLRIEKTLRQIRQQLSALKPPTEIELTEHAKLFAQWSYAILMLLRHGYIPSEAMSEAVWNHNTYSFSDGIVKVTIDKVQFSVPFNVKFLTNLANVFTTQRDLLNIADVDLCIFVRYCLGHKTS